MAASACQPKAADAQKNNTYSESHDGYSKDEDDDGDDGAYGDHDESTQNHSPSDSTETSDAVVQSTEESSKDADAMTHSEEGLENASEGSQESIAFDSPDGEEISSLDVKLEAVEAIPTISENYQESESQE
jgi:hypothetical protein